MVDSGWLIAASGGVGVVSACAAISWSRAALWSAGDLSPLGFGAERRGDVRRCAQVWIHVEGDVSHGGVWRFARWCHRPACGTIHLRMVWSDTPEIATVRSVLMGGGAACLNEGPPGAPRQT